MSVRKLYSVLITAFLLGTVWFVSSAPLDSSEGAPTQRPTLTATMALTPSPTAPNTPRPSQTPSPTNTLRPAPTHDLTRCPLSAAFVRDVTIADDSEVAGGIEFTKRWDLRNDGSCTWPDGCELAYVSGHRLTGYRSVSVSPLAAGQSRYVAVPMRAPKYPGTYESKWRLRFGDHYFGPTIWVRFSVPDAASRAAVLAAPTAKPLAAADIGYTCDRCIKGNVSYKSGERIYHLPGCPYYDTTVINPKYGERWFSSEAEARAAGWRKAYNCP